MSVTKLPKIPKTIHQFWFGDQSKRPTKFLQTWKDKHPDWEYILWTEDEIAKRGIIFECNRQINEIPEINGKADIIRWEILYQFGGVAMDADSYCITSLNNDIDLFLNNNGWSSFENENVRKGLVACGAMGFPPKHPLLRDIINHIKTLDLHPSICQYKAWVTVAVALITQILDTGKYLDFTILPSHMFLPYHFTGVKYDGHKIVYAYQEWGSTKQNYDQMNQIELPADLVEPTAPTEWISILIPSFNADPRHVRECLDSIRQQIGYFGMEIVWINDGSDGEHSEILEQQLDTWKKSTRFCNLVYKRLSVNCGIGTALVEGTGLCSHDLIFRMDADDVMKSNRITKQLVFMKNNTDCMLCGTNIQFFQDAELINGGKYKLT